MIYRKVEDKDRQQLLQLHYDFHITYHREELLKNSPILPLLQYTDPKISMNKSVNEMYDGSHISFLAVDKEQIVGFISGKTSEFADKAFHKEGYIDDLFVQEAYRGKGVGKELYKHLLEEFQEMHCTHLAISAYAENEKAIAFYRKIGFNDFGILLKKKI